MRINIVTLIYNYNYPNLGDVNYKKMNSLIIEERGDFDLKDMFKEKNSVLFLVY